MFITVHRLRGGRPLELNPEQVAFMDDDAGGHAVLRIPGGEQLSIEESCDDLKALLPTLTMATAFIGEAADKPAEAKAAKKPAKAATDAAE